MSLFFFFFKQKTAYEMRISDWSSDVCSSDLRGHQPAHLVVVMVKLGGLFRRAGMQGAARRQDRPVREAGRWVHQEIPAGNRERTDRLVAVGLGEQGRRTDRKSVV